MYIIKKGEIRKVKVLNQSEDTCSVYDKKDMKILHNVKNKEIEYSYKNAEMKLKELNIVKSFKRRKANKKGICTCEWCGSKGDDLTVDHIYPLSKFGGREKIRKNKAVWREAWSYDNLQILCKECNQRKDSFVLGRDKHMANMVDYRARVLSMKKNLKHSQHKNSPHGKLGYGIATNKWASRKDRYAEYVAKADSNVLRLDMILSSVEAYDLLPRTT